MELRDHLQSALGTTYTIERELGGGGMSHVFLAEEVALGRRVVIKVLPPEMAASVNADRFAREVRLAAQLQHPQIVPVLAAGIADGIPYYTMPFVEGQSLRARLATDGALPIPLVVGIMRDVAKALEFAHEHGIVHRDIKPDNVLLAGSSAAVTDFGIAKALSASKTGGDAAPAAPAATLTQLGTSLGTPSYMAPEQAAGDPGTDRRADIYAFGCMAYELLTGKPPFAGRPPHQLVVAHLSERPAPVEEQRPDTPPALARLVMRCLEKDPTARPQTAAEILADLDAVTTGPLNANAALTPRRTRRWMPIAAGAVVIVIAIATVLALRHRPSAAVDRQVVAILPFRVAGADPAVHYLREGMIDLLSAKLSTGGGVRAVDSRTLLAAWRKAGGSDANDLPDDASRAVAARVGAGEILAGDIVGTPRQITVHATLIDATSAAKTAESSVTGPVDSLPSLVDHLAASLLTLRAGEGEQRLASLTSTSLPALRAYLDGEAAYRRGDWKSASQGFNSALDADSNFALAALGLLQTAGWYLPETGTPRATRIAWRLRDHFSPRDRAMLTVLLGPHYPAPSNRVDALAAMDAYASLAPDAPDAWYNIGDWYFHYGIGSGITDAHRRSLTAFTHALALDSTFAPALEHLPALYAQFGDSAALRRALRMLVASDSTAEGLAATRILAAASLGDSATVRSLRARIPQMDGTSLLEIAVAARGGQLGLDDGERAVRALAANALTSTDRRSALIEAEYLSNDLGHPAKAAQSRNQAWGASGNRHFWTLLDAIFWDGDTTGVSTAAHSLDSLAKVLVTQNATYRNAAAQSYFVLAQYEIWRGDTAAARRRIDQMRRITFPADSQWLAAIRDDGTLLIETQLAALGARPDARVLLTRTDSLMRTQPADGLEVIVGNFIAARAWEIAGDAPRAIAALDRVGGDSSTPPVFYSTYLRDVGRLDAATGNRNGAIRAYRQYLRLRAHPEPVLQADVDHVRSELQRLEQQRAQ